MFCAVFLFVNYFDCAEASPRLTGASALSVALTEINSRLSL